MSSLEVLVPICAIGFALANVVYFHFEGRRLDRRIERNRRRSHPAE